MSPDRLLGVLDRKYSVLLLAELARRNGAKVVTLANALGASRPAVRAALDELVARGWVRRNAGYGHPLRPEYVLGEVGKPLADVCTGLCRELSGEAGRRVTTTKWALPILLAIGSGAARFSEIAVAWAGLTDRALSLSLRDLDRAGLVTRRVVDGRPPRAEYAPTAFGRRILDLLQGPA